jgi:hypothetical protein
MSLVLPRRLGGASREDDINLEPHKLCSDLVEALVPTLSPPIFDRDRAILDPTELAQPLQESGNPLAFNGGRQRP